MMHGCAEALCYRLTLIRPATLRQGRLASKLNSPMSLITLFENGQCEKLRSPSILNLIISLALAAGIVVSYLPQHVRIFRRKTSEGISPWYILLGVSSGTCALCNILLLSDPVLSCCKVISAGECFAGTLGIAQVMLQTIMASFILVFAVVCSSPEFEIHDHYVQILAVAKVCLGFFILSVLLSVYVFFYSFGNVLFVANVMGILGTILAAIQYFPQIWTTFQLKHTGSLSIPMMCMQTPGGFLWAASLAAREGTSWSSWLPYFTSAVLQGILLIMAIYFEYFDGGIEIDQAEDLRASETSRLIGN